VLAGCETDESCERTPGTTCQEWRVCTFEREVTVYSHRRGGRMDSGLGTEPATVERTFVVGTCDPSEACMGLEEPAPPSLYLRGDEEISCAEQQLCVPEMLPPLPRIAPDEAADDASESDRSDDSRSRGARKQGKGCGCSPGPTQALPLALAGLIGGLALLGRRYP
jgi:MYXO-CTERM domain-containing protein